MPKPAPAAGQALVKITASGVNFIDVYQRNGLYKIPLPAVLGSEGAGVVEALGEGVTTLKPGDRVAWAMARGSYAEYAAVPANLLVTIPPGVEFQDAAAAMLQGMTAHYLTHSTFPLAKGQTALVHAAAGGTGRLVVQMAKMRGARVIGTVGSGAKAEVAKKAGADEIIDYNQQDFVAEVKRLTGGAGVDVVYDAVGQSTFMKSLDCLRVCRRDDGYVRKCERTRSGDRASLAGAKGVPISDPAKPRQLHCGKGRARLARFGYFPLARGEESLSLLLVDHVYPLANRPPRPIVTSRDAGLRGN